MIQKSSLSGMEDSLMCSGYSRTGRGVRGPVGSARGFTLVELLVVVGIISVLVAILLPVVSSAMRVARRTACASNLRSIGQMLVAYANDNDGWGIPIGPWMYSSGFSGPGYWATLGTDEPNAPPNGSAGNSLRPISDRWPHVLFGNDYPKILHCPEDAQQGPLPAPISSYHSYILNAQLALDAQHVVKINSPWPACGPYRTIVAGEKMASKQDYYLDIGEYNGIVELKRHGSTYGVNYLFMDWHVSNELPCPLAGQADPWDPFGS